MKLFGFLFLIFYKFLSNDDNEIDFPILNFYNELFGLFEFSVNKLDVAGILLNFKFDNEFIFISFLDRILFMLCNLLADPV
jgi:hypothetical protein